MAFVITLVAPDALAPQIVADVVGAVGATRTVRLGERAADIYPVAAAGSRAALRQSVADALGGHAVDAIVQPIAHRTKRLVVSDMDSTLVAQEGIDELAALCGAREAVSAITARAMAGELDFSASLRARVALLQGLSFQTVVRLAREAITLSPGAATLIATLRKHGVRTVLVSGGFEAFAAPLAQALGIDAAHANRLETADERLSGGLIGPLVDAEAKRTHLIAHAAQLGATVEAALAIGDGANDLAMLGEAGLGVAYRAKPKVAAAADAAIVHTDLTTVLYAMGIHPDDFAIVSDDTALAALRTPPVAPPDASAADVPGKTRDPSETAAEGLSPSDASVRYG